MLSVDAKLDYELLRKICETGHSRVPVYEEVEVPMPPHDSGPRTRKVKKILGILLVKQCVLLDPKGLCHLPLIELFLKVRFRRNSVEKNKAKQGPYGPSE